MTALTPQREVISYSVGVQTSEPWIPTRRYQKSNGLTDSEGESSPSTTRTPRAKKRLSRREREREDELREQLRQELQAESQAARESGTQLLTSKNEDLISVRVLPAEELASLTSNDNFLNFIERSSKVAERRIDQGYDVLADYALESFSGYNEDDDHYEATKGRKAYSVKEVAQFYDERWSKKRMISDVNFSPKV